MRKFKIDINTAKQLEALRVENDWSMRQLYAYYLGEDANTYDLSLLDPVDYDTFRKNVERKRGDSSTI